MLYHRAASLAFARDVAQLSILIGSWASAITVLGASKRPSWCQVAVTLSSCWVLAHLPPSPLPALPAFSLFPFHSLKPSKPFVAILSELLQASVFFPPDTSKALGWCCDSRSGLGVGRGLLFPGFHFCLHQTVPVAIGLCPLCQTSAWGTPRGPSRSRWLLL